MDGLAIPLQHTKVIRQKPATHDKMHVVVHLASYRSCGSPVHRTGCSRSRSHEMVKYFFSHRRNGTSCLNCDRNDIKNVSAPCSGAKNFNWHLYL
jgi:hypothetical protein